jgi:hypothetical protein
MSISSQILASSNSLIFLVIERFQVFLKPGEEECSMLKQAIAQIAF